MVSETRLLDQELLADRTQQVVLEGHSFQAAPVPQGTVKGPLLFLVHINDLLSRVDSKVSLFTDDSMLYRIINTDESAKKLQTDLDCLRQWDGFQLGQM